MSDLLPIPWTGKSGSRQLAKATRAQEQTELQIFKNGLATRFQAECERQDAQALADVVRCAMDEEMTTLDYGLERAGGSQAKAELVSRLVSIQSRIDAQRITRRFEL